MLRIKPNVTAGGNTKIQTGHSNSKFGIDISQKKEILEICQKYSIQVIAIHQHTGSDIKDIEVFKKVAELIFELAEDFPDLKAIDLGGGFKVKYSETDQEADIEEIGKVISESFLQFCQKSNKKLELWFEPGKFLVSESGYLLVKANVVKKTPHKTFIGVNSGLNHLIRPMMYDAYHEIINLSNDGTNDGTKEKYTVVGYVCETDTFGTDREIFKVKEGDILALKNAGAYGFTMSSQYNSRLRPAEVLVINQQAHLIRKRETFEDIIHNQMDIF